MTDTFSKRKRSSIMAAVRSNGNKETELKLAALFRKHRVVNWRRHQPGVRGRPDFIFRKQRVAIFVDGCFWHGCRKHCRMPKANREYWMVKIAQNRARDRLIGRELRREGWSVIRIWAHALAQPRQVISRINSVLRERTSKKNLGGKLTAKQFMKIR
jgi:DNA mismatch endonuclease (patch repair protein)